MKSLIYKSVPAIVAILLLAVMAPPGASAGSLEFFPVGSRQTSAFAPLLRSAAIEVQYMYETAGMDHYAAFNFGASVPMLAYRTDSLAFETGGRGGIFSRFEMFSESFNFVTADFMGGGYGSIAAGEIALDASVYHVSSHIGDEYLVYDGAAIANTGYEAARLCATWAAAKWLSLSAGAEYLFGRRPRSTVFYDGLLMFEGRIDLLSFGVPLFFEGAVESVGWYRYANAAARLGLYLRYFFNTTLMGEEYRGSEPHELSVTYYYGFSKALYFSRKRESLVLMGPTYRF